MSKLSALPSYVFRVTWSALDGLPREDSVKAAYFQEQGVYTVFKDAEHAAVDSYKTDHVVRIERRDAR